MLAPGAALADVHHPDDGYTTKCPVAENLVQGTTWHNHTLVPGVTLREGRRNDARGYVDMHVLDVAVTNKHLRFAPLVRRLAQRSDLTSLATGKTGLVAATNTGYFDYDAGTPLGPLVDGNQPWVGMTTPAAVVGLSDAGLVQAGHVALAGTVVAGTATQPLAGLNTVRPVNGLTAYSSRWGRTPVFLPHDAVARYVTSGRLATAVGQFDSAPSSGFLLVARGTAAKTWLTALPARSAVRVSTRLTSDTAQPFAQAYAVGSRLVHKGVAKTGMECRRRYPQPARTAIGFSADGKRLILAVVADHPGAAMHGLDADQTARLMHDLGASEAYMFDGSGSSEMLARMPSKPGALSMRNLPADGVERPMPVGFGIFRR